MRRLFTTLTLAALVIGVAPSGARASEPTEDEIARAQGHMRSAYAWVRSNKLPVAVREYRKALDLVPGNADLLYNLVSLTSAQKDCAGVLLYGSAFGGVAGRTKEMGEVRKMMDQCDNAGGVGRLEVTGAPVRADVWVDGVMVGKAPLKPLSLAAGEHTLRVSAPDFTDWSGSASVEEKQTASVEAKPTAIVYTGYLLVKTTPADGVRVYVDERLVGTTPMERMALDTGRHLVRFELPGWDRWVRYVTIEKEATEDLEATLEQTEEEGHLTDAQD